LLDGYGSDKNLGRLAQGVNKEGEAVFFQTGSDGSVSIVDGITPQTVLGKENAKTEALIKREKKLQSTQNKLKEQEIKLLKQQLDLRQQETMQGAKDREIGSQLELGNAILNSKELDSIFGRGEALYPDLLRSQGGIDLKADVNQFVGQLKLAAAGKMKGQGSVSDSERKTLNEAATVLSNANISPERARKAVQNSVNAIMATMNQASSGTAESKIASPNVIRFDNQGNIIP
jgi:hypothetical protein